uniref:Alternative protein CTDSPL2 n=1 Tax=Homo sapiens TaxID=9606 RepID=L8E9X2_HUMAN|nr:alternative protein CTDSPL2 [Homo sapiens]
MQLPQEVDIFIVACNLLFGRLFMEGRICKSSYALPLNCINMPQAQTVFV